MFAKSIEKPEAGGDKAGESTSIYVLTFVLLLSFHLAANMWWLGADNHTIRTDEEGHMVKARSYLEAFTDPAHGGPFERLIAVGKIEPGIPAHPPLLHVAGALMVMLFGYSVDIMAAFNSAAFLLTLLGVLLIARRFLDPWPALFAVFVVSFVPLIYVGSRYFMTDYLSMMLSVWAIYVLLRSGRFRNVRWVFLFAILNGLNILTRAPGFLNYLIPAALVFFAGIHSAFGREGAARVDKTVLGNVLFNALLTVVVSTGVFAPWYFNHLDRFYNYWVYEHQAGVSFSELQDASATNPAAPAPHRNIAYAAVVDLEVGAEDASEADDDQAAAVQEGTPAEGGRSASSVVEKLWRRVADPPVPWSRYPVLVNNNAVFLPLLVLGLLGILLAAFHPQYRSFETLVLLAWLLGSWCLMTLLFRFATVRYMLQALPALGIFAALPVLALPKGLPRRIGGGVVAALLLFQWGNLTVQAYGPLRQATLPAQLNGERIVVYKDDITMAGSYSALSAPTQKNYKDQLLMAMARAEKEQEGLRSGEFANYVKVNIRGMVLDEQHFWPPPNPYLRGDIAPEDLPVRKLRLIDHAANPEGVLEKLPNADYVLFSVDTVDEITEEEWRRFFEQHKFAEIERFVFPAFGVIPERTYSVMARLGGGMVVSIDTPADLDRFGLEDLYRFINSPNFQGLSAEMQEYARTRLRQLIEKDAFSFKIDDHLTLMTVTGRHDVGKWYRWAMVFRVDKAMAENRRIYFHGRVQEQYVSLLPERFRELRTHYWNFGPDPPTSTWKEGEYVLISHRIDAERIPYEIFFGFMDEEANLIGERVNLGVIDLGTLHADAREGA